MSAEYRAAISKQLELAGKSFDKMIGYREFKVAKTIHERISLLISLLQDVCKVDKVAKTIGVEEGEDWDLLQRLCDESNRMSNAYDYEAEDEDFEEDMNRD